MPCCQTISGVQKRPRQAQLGRVRRAAPRAASRAVAHPVSRVIECACARDASAMPALLVAVVRAPCRGALLKLFSDVGNALRNPLRQRPPTYGLQHKICSHQRGRKRPARVKDGSLNVSHRRWRFMVSGYVKLSGLMGGRLRGGAMHCGGQTARRFAAELPECADSQGQKPSRD